MFKVKYQKKLKFRKITEFSEVIRKETELEKQEGERQHRQRVRSEVAKGQILPAEA